MGYGCVANDNPHFFGMIGMHGTYAGNLSTKAADLLIGCGVRFDDRVTGLLDDFAIKAKIVHLDIDPAEINKNVVADLKVVGDLRWSLHSLLRRVKETPQSEWRQRLNPWQEQMEAWQKAQPPDFCSREGCVMPQAAIRELSRLADRRAILVTDVGQHQMWAAQFFAFRQPRSFVTSGGLGAMGFGLSAAIGAQVGNPDRQVICVSGDGGFMMNCQELSTLADLELPVKLFVLNNRCLGMVAQWQRNFFGGRYACSHLPTKTDFVRLAEAMGVRGARVTDPACLTETLRDALRGEGPVLTEIIIPEDEDVLPMVPAGARLDQMILGGMSR
jgi:acetolactate synthase-1/2/3 large subunit